MLTAMRFLLLFVLAMSGWAQTVDYSKDIQPIFTKRCAGCHGAAQQMSGLRLDSPSAVIKGSYTGPVVVAGKAADSKLIQRVSSDKKGFAMPPVGAPLTAAEIAALRSWIDAGATVPADSAAREQKSTHWSFQPVKRPSGDSIDFFIRARLAKEGLQPSPEADRRTLIRRVSLDLVGLPPTPREVEEFASDQRPDAYERLVDRLLASQHYGEKWARHWLDLAHYADSDGYEKDQVRPNAWRYRHWVINALNRDMPFDEFTIEQLAGDLLPNATVDQVVATGFLRNTLTNREAGVDRAEDRFEQLINRTNTVSTTWLGLTMGCSQCHNHKFDPITQKDYYSMFAFFERAEERSIEAPLAGESGPYFAALPDYERKRSEILDSFNIPPLYAKWQARMREAFAHQGANLEWDFAVTSFRAMFDNADRFLKGGVEKLERHEQDRLLDYFLNNPGPDITNRDKASLEVIKQAHTKMSALSLPPYSLAPVMARNPEAPATHIHIGGDYKNLGVEVKPATPSFLSKEAPENATRLTLAKWIASRDNPLTARVAVNRMWQELFGRGLVVTSEDFGTQGDRPSHPELLDWLASEFMDHGWSMKAIQKEIVMSATYRQSSNIRKDVEARDPENVLLARQSRIRLPAELVRDEALAASGLLNPAIGGRSIRPFQPAGVAELGYGHSVKWKESEGADRYRRGLYIHYQRTTPYPFLSNFDGPESNVTCSRRRRSDTPLQSLNLLNDPVFFEAAQGLAARVDKDVQGGFSDKIDYVFELVLGRKPKTSERERLAKYFDEQGAGKAAWVGVSRVLLNLDEFVTRE
jgi:mono/diheme cytochrome c family protein